MSTYESLSHSKWDCKYHIVFVPKGRKKELYGKVRKFLGPVFHELAAQRRSEMLEGHMVQDHVHMLIRIPPKYSVAEVVGYLKGESAIAVARQFGWCPSIACIKEQRSNVERSLVELGVKVAWHAIAQQGFHDPRLVRHTCRHSWAIQPPLG